VVFSPIAWNLAFDDFLFIFDEGPSLAICFSDDGYLLITDPDPITFKPN
jgi:hypothetical protein